MQHSRGTETPTRRHKTCEQQQFDMHYNPSHMLQQFTLGHQPQDATTQILRLVCTDFCGFALHRGIVAESCTVRHCCSYVVGPHRKQADQKLDGPVYFPRTQIPCRLNFFLSYTQNGFPSPRSFILFRSFAYNWDSAFVVSLEVALPRFARGFSSSFF